MALQIICCLFIMAGAGQAAPYGRESSSSEQLLVELRTLVYRLSTDLASVMEDTKTVMWFTKTMTSNSEDEKRKKEADVIPSCEGIAEGLASLQIGSNPRPVTVPCDGDGWIVFLRRIDNEHDFPGRDWSDYKDGFGNLKGSFWLGLDSLFLLTNPKPASMRVELEAWDGEVRTAEYSFFRIESERYAYRLHVDGYNTGDAGDSLNYHNGMKFSTRDRDNDEAGHCAKNVGGWWFKSCFTAYLTGSYEDEGEVGDWEGLKWKSWKEYTNYSLKRAEMKLRLD